MIAMIAQFLHALFGDDLAGLFLLIWIKRGKLSRFFTDVDAAAGFAAEVSVRGGDVYVGCGLRARDHGPNLRGGSDDVAAIAGLWVDVDFAGPAHQKQDLPPSRAAALEVLRALPLRPTLIVDSGHGLQPHWLFKESWIFESSSDRTSAARCVAGWEGFVRQRMAEHGWSLDSTHDLARVLRLPGTTNYKIPGAPVAVSTLHGDGPRYDPSDFDDWIGAAPAALVSSFAMGPQFLVSSGAAPPSAKLETLLANKPRFRGAFERTRRDYPSGKHTDSEHDAAIAAYAVRSGWSDEEIGAAIAESRRLYGRKPDAAKKGLRLDYLRRTIARARASRSAKNPSLRVTRIVLTDETPLRTVRIALDDGGAT